MKFYSFARGLLSVIFKIIFRMKIYGEENIPLQGRIIVCANHVSVLDPIVVAIAVPRNISFMAKKELFSNKILSFIIRKLGAFPVDREGADLSAVKRSLKILKNEQALGIFLEGGRIKEQDINNAKPGTAMMSIKGKSLVLPVYIDTDYKIFRDIKVNIGKPISLSEYYNEKLSVDEYKQISKEILKNIYNLK